MPRGAVRFFLALLVVSFLPAVGVSGRDARAQRATSERLILTPSADTTFRVQAVYPNAGVTCEAHRRKDLRARYRGRLEIFRQSDGRLGIINHLTFDEYLRGLAEVPRSWPFETLKAQVVAARSYALYHLQHRSAAAQRVGYDICSTDACQVYRGVQIEQGAFGDAWIRAVTETRGRALLYDGEPIQAFYHSTSPGKTKRSFPGGTALPYLTSVDGQDDDSPLALWTVRVPFAHLARILGEAGLWSGGTISSVSLDGSTVRLSGAGGSRAVGKSEFRSGLNREAPCLYPEAYPGPGSTGRTLPQTVPSIDFSMTSQGGAAVMTGRGWGHGVGMSQYGARSLGERGRRYDQILEYFYNGVRPAGVDEPGRIRVLVVEDASLIRVEIEGDADVETAAGSAIAPGDRFEVRGGSSLDIRRGVGPSLEPILTVAPAVSALTVPHGGTIELAYILSGSAKVALIVRRGNDEILRTPDVSQNSGPNALSVRAAGASAQPTASAPPSTPSDPPPAPGSSVTPTPTTTLTAETSTLAPGVYEVTLEAFDGIDRVRSQSVVLTVEPPPAPEPSSPDGDEETGTGLITLFAAVAVLLAGTGIFVSRRRRRA